MAVSISRIHPLQRLASPSRGVSALVHASGLASFIWSFKYMHDNPNPANEAYGWHFQYLTVIGLSLATTTFAAGLLADITLSPRLFLLKNLLSICSAPMEVLISILYWGLRLVNISFHAIPSIVFLIDILFLSPPWTITIGPALGLSSAIAVTYWFWVDLCFQNNGWYPYPIFEQVPFEGRVGLFVLSAVVMALSTATLKWLYGRVNGFGTPVKAHARPGASPLSLTTESTTLHAEAANPINSISKSQARTLTKRLAHVFRTEFGIGAEGPGKDAVLCISSNQVLLPTIFYAILGAGGVYAAASTALTAPEVTKQLRQSRSRLIITCTENKAKALKAAQECRIARNRVLVLESMGHKRLLYDTINPERNYLQRSTELEWDRITDVETLENTTICLLYSSGTTGPPKGVMLSHMNLVSEALFTQLILRDSKKRRPHFDVPYRTVGHLPTAHIAGCLGYFITPAVAGGTVYWMPRFDIDDFIDYCKKYEVTFLATAPPVYHAIVQSNRVTDHFRTLVRAESGAAPLSTELQEQAERKLGCSISQRWGMTESTGSVTTMPWGQSDSTGSISPLLPNTRLRIVDEHMRDVGREGEGEILLKGPMISKGYFDNPEATTDAFTPEGWYKTGDVGVHNNGRTYVVDRIKELIKYKGLQVSPVEVEGFLLTHDCVADVAVIGAPDPEAPGNELPRAYVVLKPGKSVSEAELKEFVKSNLARHKQLRGGVSFVNEIPQSASGKVLRRILRDQARSSTRRQAKL
ncbi:putative integral membrane protein [Aspergillus lucknowensis]|uniref:Acetyl-CoA synthetase-like protein n=1 Tax=Aspergillus lucknowensis TaxID=176173 RepID=A0ABR4LZN6_9EURO